MNLNKNETSNIDYLKSEKYDQTYEKYFSDYPCGKRVCLFVFIRSNINIAN